MKNKKTLLYISLYFMIVLLVVACTKEGPQGIPGNPGDAGPAGVVGPAGKDGSTFLAGSGAPDAKIGNLGDYYLDQQDGDLYGPKTTGGWGSPFPFAKQEGGSMLVGSNAPGTTVGVAGDFYLDTVNYTIYGPKTAAGRWNIGLLLNGSGGNSGITAYIIARPYDYMTGESYGDGDENPFYLYIPYDDHGLFNLWKDVNQDQDLLAVYLKQKIPIYGRSVSGDDSTYYQDLISFADGVVSAGARPDEDRGIEVAYETEDDGIFISFLGEDERCHCDGARLLDALETDLGLESVIVFVISPSAVQQVMPLPSGPVKVDVRDPYHEPRLQHLIESYLK